ncbi:hypothetical protein PCANC_26644 [Puccinia coronata f. sp. avenae]|nr:hypothetical protein PCANC_26644 [Puccinia coronata f. sp. avenae]
MPMCLVIVGIIRPPKHSSPLKGSAPASEILELSDGWYKIKAHLDPVLVRVLKRGALRVGFKLAISGACTEAPAASQPKAQQMGQKKTTAKGPSDEGAEEEEVRLYLEGNGTSRVRWAETLGLRPRPWVATLPSLTPDGGKIPLMDILVVKVFPPSFVDQEGRMGRWELAQEKKLQVAWEKEREKEAAKIALEQEKEGEKIMQVADLVASIYSSKCAEHRRVSSGDRKGGDGEEGSGFDADELCEDVIEGDVLPNELQALPVDRLAQLRQAVQRRYESFRSTGAEELQKTLNMRVPIRRTRNTQVLSFRDFHHSSSKHSSRPPLVGQISVQDLSRLPEDFFKAGVRYWVENLQPQRNVRWESSSSHSHSTSRIGSCEVPLTTRRDTRWTVISLDA